jgi:hypothetical protein
MSSANSGLLRHAAYGIPQQEQCIHERPLVFANRSTPRHAENPKVIDQGICAPPHTATPRSRAQLWMTHFSIAHVQTAVIVIMRMREWSGLITVCNLLRAGGLGVSKLNRSGTERLVGTLNQNT